MNYLTFLFILIFLSTKAQQPFCNAGIMGTGRSFVASEKPTGMPVNFSSLVNANRSFVEMSVINRYSVSELTSYVVAGALKINPNNAVSLSIQKTGTGAYSEQCAGIAISKRLAQKFSTAIGIHYYLWQFDDARYGNSSVWIPELSFLLKALPQLNLGVIVSNPARTRMNAIEKSLPAVIESGIASGLSEKLTVAASVTASSGQPMIYHGGLEYNYSKQLLIRTGFRSSPLSQSFGFKIGLSNYALSLSVLNTPPLGLSSSASILFKL